MMGATGLDYPAVFQTAAVLGLKMNAALFRKVQLLESLYLDNMNAARKESGNGK